jgi:hypothetical protein
MKKSEILFCLLSLFFFDSKAQFNKGIHFQGVARNNNGLIIANKIIQLRLSILTDSSNGNIEYQEIKSITTNAIGLFSVAVGSREDRKIISIGNFENINWSNTEKYLQVDVDIFGDLNFVTIGCQKINYVPYAFYADKVDAININGILSVKKGGTGFDNIKDFKIMAGIDKVNNTPDSLKGISIATNISLNEKLKKIDTIWMSNRIDQKLNKTDTIYMSNRIDQKLNKLDTIYISNRINQKLNSSDTIKIYNKINALPIIDTNSLSQRINVKLNKTDTSYMSNRIDQKLNKLDTIYISNRINQKLNSSDTTKIYNKINALPIIDTNSLSQRINNKLSIDSLTANKITTTLNYTPVPNDFGSFYDTTKQTVTIAAAIPIKFNFTNFANNVALTNNTSGLPTRITVNNAGLYNIKYTLQFIKTDASNDELSVWLRRNSAAYVNTNNTYTILGTGIKNTFSNSFFVALGDNDYVEIYFSVKNINTNLSGSNTQLTPSRPATPAAMVTVQRIN